MADLEAAAAESWEHEEKEMRHFLRFTRAQRFLHATLFTTFLGLAATGLPMRFSESPWARGMAHAVGGFGGFMLALIATLWAYDGWNDLTMVAGEVRRPERSLPIALIGGLFIVGVLFMATNAAIQYILPAAQIAHLLAASARGYKEAASTVEQLRAMIAGLIALTLAALQPHTAPKKLKKR